MADTKTYSLQCPDESCLEEFDIELTPEALKDGADPIQCPTCGEEWEWVYDPETDTLELVEDLIEDEGADETGLTCTDDDDDPNED